MSKEVLQKVADAVTDRPTTIVVDVNYSNRWQKKLQKWNVLPKQRQFDIAPITLGSLIRISKLLLEINISIEELKVKWKDSSYQAMYLHSETMAKVIATAIQNTREEPPASLVAFILNHFSSKELLAVMNIITGKMDITSFISTIVSARGINVLESQTAGATTASKSEASPLTRTETIAPGTSLEE
jgi:hypothetical protein